MPSMGANYSTTGNNQNHNSGGIDISSILGSLGTLFGGISTGGWGAIAGGVLGGLASLGKSDQTKKYEQIFNKLEDSEEYLKSTPFSKDEIMNVLLPQAQKTYRGAADILAGKAGAQAGESGMSGGQAFSEYYTQALAPVIAQGEQNAGDAISRFGQWFSQLDDAAKNRFLDATRMQLQSVAGVDNMTDLQKFISGGSSMAQFGANIGGELDILGELNKRLGLNKGLQNATTNFGNTQHG